MDGAFHGIPTTDGLVAELNLSIHRWLRRLAEGLLSTGLMKMKSISSPTQNSRARSLQPSRSRGKAPAAAAALFLGTKAIGELRILMRLAAPSHRVAPRLTEESFRSF
jgi:hypothetical protein